MYVCNSLKNTDLVASWHIITIYMQYIKPLVTPFNHLFINLIQSTNITKHEEDGNQNHNELSPRTYQNGYQWSSRRQEVTNIDGNVEKEKPCVLLMVLQIGAASTENSREVPQKMKNRTTICSSNPISGNISERNKNVMSQRHLHPAPLPYQRYPQEPKRGNNTSLHGQTNGCSCGVDIQWNVFQTLKKKSSSSKSCHLRCKDGP